MCTLEKMANSEKLLCYICKKEGFHRFNDDNLLTTKHRIRYFGGWSKNHGKLISCTVSLSFQSVGSLATSVELFARNCFSISGKDRWRGLPDY